MGLGQCVNIRDHNIMWRRGKKKRGGGVVIVYNRVGEGCKDGMGWERKGWDGGTNAKQKEITRQARLQPIHLNENRREK